MGGRALTDDIRPQISYSVYCDTLRHAMSYLNSTARPAETRLAASN
jgi:hypothetical protein